MNRSAFDLFTLAHFAVGLIMGAQRVPRALAYTIIVGTEVLEFALRDRLPGFFMETAENIASDVIASAGGYELARGL